MFSCETVNCPSGGVVETGENFTCLNCNRVQSIILYGDCSKQPENCLDSISIKIIDRKKNSAGLELAKMFCDKNQYNDSILQDIKKLEKTFKCSNSKISFAVATFLTLKKNNTFVSCQYLADFFSILYSSLRKCKYFQDQGISNIEIRGLIEKIVDFLDLDYKSVEIIANMIKNDKTLSSGLNPLVTISVFLCKYLVESNIFSIQRASVAVSNYFKINRITVLRHTKKVCLREKEVKNHVSRIS